MGVLDAIQAWMPGPHYKIDCSVRVLDAPTQEFRSATFQAKGLIMSG